MKITRPELIQMQACEGGLRRFTMQTNMTNEPVEILSLIRGKNTHSDLLWLAGAVGLRKQLLQFSIDMVVSVLPFNDNDRTRRSLLALRDVYENDTVANRTICFRLVHHHAKDPILKMISTLCEVASFGTSRDDAGANLLTWALANLEVCKDLYPIEFDVDEALTKIFTEGE